MTVPKTDVVPKGRTRTKQQRQAAGRVDAMLGDLKKPWIEFCRARNLTASDGIKRAVHRLLTGVPQAQPYGVHAVVERKTRLEVKLTESERAAAEKRAQLEGFATPNLWVAAVVRAALTRSPQFGTMEIEALGESNLQLLKIGTNLNQIAKRLNAAQVGGNVEAYDPQLVEELAAAVRKHVRKVGDALRASIYRWGLKDPSDR